MFIEILLTANYVKKNLLIQLDPEAAVMSHQASLIHQKFKPAIKNVEPTINTLSSQD